MSGANCSKYDQLLEQARGSAKYWVPKLCEALRRENSEMSNDDIRERVTQDCLPIWQKSTIRDALTDEYKQIDKAQAGKKGRQKQLEQAGGTLTVTEGPELPAILRAENGSNSSTGQKSQTSIRPSPEEMNAPQQSQLNNSNQELQKAEERISAIQGRQNTEDVPNLNSEGVGPVNADNDIRTSDTYKRDLALHVYGLGEHMRKKIATDGKASRQFYIFAMHKKSQIEYIVPVNFTVDFNKMTMSLVLDEGEN
jgi:hypothetical protein